MVHTYEVLVDVKEYVGQADVAYRSGTTRYEIDAESREKADDIAKYQAKSDHPHATEYDVRVTRFLK